jgi:hypothetical protein
MLFTNIVSLEAVYQEVKHRFAVVCLQPSSLSAIASLVGSEVLTAVSTKWLPSGL